MHAKIARPYPEDISSYSAVNQQKPQVDTKATVSLLATIAGAEYILHSSNSVFTPWQSLLPQLCVQSIQLQDVGILLTSNVL